MAGPPVGQEAATADLEAQGGITVNLEEGEFCVFPFRLKDILYYACTNLTDAGLGASAEKPVTVCALSIDNDFNPLTMGFCSAACPIQRE